MIGLYIVSAASLMFFAGLSLGIFLGRQDGKKFKGLF